MTADVLEDNYSKVREVATREGISLSGVTELEGLETGEVKFLC